MNNFDENIIYLAQRLNDKLKINHVEWHKLKGKKIEVAEEIFKDFTNLVSGTDKDLKVLNEEDSLYALKGVGGFPMRVKCATMAWHAFNQALKD